MTIAKVLSQHDLPEILFITSFPPRECGIATYSQDLIHALNLQFEDSFITSICALESANEKHTYSTPPKFILNTDKLNSFANTSYNINKDTNIKLVVMQHEFGFFASKELEFESMFERITKPIVFVFHTVLPKPDENLKLKVQTMSNIASAVIVMTQDAATILMEEYNIAHYKITVIPHGTHLVPPLDRNKLKRNYRLTGRKVLSTFGLLGSSKSIETSLDALPAIIKLHPEVLFLILGKTHPSIVKHEGEKYRSMLEEKVKTLHLQDNVRFVNEYLQLNVLLEYLQLSDIYLFTSNDPMQAVSGTFSYAVSSGCPVVSTPIPHAREVLKDNNGIIIDFGNSNQLTEAVLLLLEDEKLREKISSNSFHKMSSTAWQNSAIAHALLFKKLTENSLSLNYKIPSINIQHVKKMTSEIGMLQFCKISIPDIHSGYTLDDNARALIAICQHYELFQDKLDLSLISTYLKFIHSCQLQNGKFLNYVNEKKHFTEQNFSENLEDSNGRAIWALGYLISLRSILPLHISIEAETILEKALPNVEKIHSTRAMAFIIKGLHYQNKNENTFVIRTLANRMVQMYHHEKNSEWFWFESYLTYGNSLLPEALLCAYQITHNEEYKTIAKESFDFLLSKIFITGKIKVISNNGWHIRDGINKSNLGGEQPIDVAYTIMALEHFYMEFKKEDYRLKTTQAFNWFLGDNHLQQIVYNPCTGGCYDGVEAHNVNLNQGAESTLSYLLSRLTMEKIKLKTIESQSESKSKFTSKSLVALASVLQANS
jgi:glycosyltransferase involved in cell wall biosynthesis